MFEKELFLDTLGDGISLFKRKLYEEKLKLVKVKSFNMDVVQMHYKRIK